MPPRGNGEINRPPGEPGKGKMGTIRCPICKKEVDLASGLALFCSQRCRLLDLGNWALERYVIPSPLTEEERQAVEERRASDE